MFVISFKPLATFFIANTVANNVANVVASIGASLLFISANTLADESPNPIEEIVVRGEFRQPNLSDLAASVTVFDPSALRRTQINHLEELLGWAANVNYSNGASRGRFLQIRGIGERGQFVEPLNPSVGLTLDGVDLSGVGTAGTLYDIAQVEIFRGPQGTLYGANALAGFINLVSHDAQPDFGGRVDLDLGNYDARGLGAVLTGPLSETMQFRLAARQYQDDGFIRNQFLGKDDTNERDELTLRGKLSWQPSDRHNVSLSLGYIDVDSGYDAFSLDNNRRTHSDEPGRDEQQTRYASLRWDWNAAQSFDLVVALGNVDTQADYGYDEDWTFAGFDPIGYRSTDRYERDRQSTNVEVRATSTPDGLLFNDSTSWTIGTYGLTQDVEFDRTYTFAGPFDSRFEFDRAAVYGELQHRLRDNLTLVGGLRVERHSASYSDNAGVRLRPKDTLVGGRLLAEWDLPNGALAYAGITRGYKAGLFNTDGSLDADLREYNPESLWNLEVGVKTTMLDDRLQLNAAVFWMERRDMQVATSIVRVRPDNSAEFIDYTDNAAEGSNYGLELEVSFAVHEKLGLFASLGLLETELEDYINGAGDNLDGRDQAQAPGYQFLLAAEYAPTARIFARVEIEGKDDYLLSDSHTERAPAYELLNLTLGYATERWQAKLWARNLTDEEVVTRGFFFGNDPRDGYTARGFNQLGEPRNVGLSLSMTY
jgi:iron complex outermembrane receptor protein